MLRLIITSIMLFLVPIVAHSAIINLPATHQTASHGTNDDGALRKGVAWPNPRYINNNNGTVTDLMTGLIWLGNGNCLAGTRTWDQARTDANTLANGSCGLSDGSIAGDWRLPNRTELLSLIDYAQGSTATSLNGLGVGFNNLQGSWSWTSDTLVGTPTKKWAIYLPNGASGAPAASSANYGLAVRDVLPAASILVSPNSKNFGSIVSSSSSTAVPFTIRNTGAGNLAISNISLGGDDADMFSITPGNGSGGTCGSLAPTIAAGGSCRINLTFTPSSSSTKNATLQIDSNDATAATMNIALSGNGILTSGVVSPIINLPATHQTVSHGTNDDGALRKGIAWPNPRYINNNNGTVTDLMTGLIWLGNGNCLAGTRTWDQARTDANTLANGSCGLSDGSIAGDWRLPNRTELLSLIDYAQGSTATSLNGLGVGFNNLQGSWSWTSDTLVGTPTKKWAIYLPNGASGAPAASSANYGLAVRDVLPAASILVSPNSKNFGSIVSSSSSTAVPFTIRNTGAGNLAISNISLGGDDADMFSITPGNGSGGTCGSLAPTIAAGGSCRINLTFTPSSSSTKNATLQIDSNDATAATMNIALSGNGILTSGVVSPIINLPATHQTVSHGTNDDGALRKGVAWPNPRYINNNNGTVTDLMTGLIWLGNGNCLAGTRTWDQARTDANTLANGSCGLSDGSIAGDWRLPNRTELLSLIDYAQGSTATSLNGLGVGFNNLQGSWSWTSDTLVGTPTKKWAIYLPNGAAGAPAASAAYYGLAVRDPFAPKILISPSSKNYGSITTAATSLQPFTIFNSGNQNLTVTDISLVGTNPGMFNLAKGDGTLGTCGAAPLLAPSASCTINVTFAPNTTGNLSATLRFASNDPDFANKDITLTGTGVLPTWTISASATAGGSISPTGSAIVNNNATKIFTLTADAGFTFVNITGTCPAGSGDATSYSTGAIVADCTVTANYALDTNRASIPRFVYVANQGDSTVSVYTVDPASGALTYVSAVATGDGPIPVTIHPSGRFAYVANEGSDTVSTYAINQITGELTVRNTVASEFAPKSVAVDPSGRFAYVTNLSSYGLGVSVYTIDQATGALTAGTPVYGGYSPNFVTVDPSGRFAYVLDDQAVDTILAYAIDQTTGALAGGTTVATGSHPFSVTVDPSGRFAYVANGASNNVSVYTIDRITGALTDVGTPVATGTTPYSVAVDPSGRFAYVANINSNNVSAYTIDQTTGALTTVGAPVPSGTAPYSVAVDPSGRFAYVANVNSSNISVYAIDQTSGALAAISGSPFATGTAPYSITVTTGVSLPTPPLSLAATAGNGSVTLRWTYVAGATSYNVYYSTTGEVSTNGTKITGATNGGTITGLTGGTSYYFVVTAVNAIGESVISGEVSAVPLIAYTVTPSANSGGSISPNTSQLVTNGSTTEFTITPDVGFSASVGGSCGGTLIGSTYTTHAITADCTVEAAFAIATYAVTFDLNGGTLTGGGALTQTITHNQAATAPLFTAPTGKTFTGWSTTFASITANTTVTAQYVDITYTVTFASSGNGSLSGSTSQTIPAGSNAATVTALPDSGYHFANWKEGAAIVATTAALSISNVSSDHSYMANFVVDPVDGRCGESAGAPFVLAPTLALCAAGTPSEVTESATWDWSCCGSYGGSPVDCSAAIDLSGPILTLSTLADGATTNNAILNVAGLVSSLRGVASLTINDTPIDITNGRFSTPVILPTGASTLSVVAIDTLGHSTTESRIITLDRAAPLLTVSAPADNSQTSHRLTMISGTIDATSTVTVTHNNGTAESATLLGSTFSAAVNLVDGLNIIALTVTDLGGKTASVVRSVTYDSANPSLAITAPSQDIATTASPLTLSGSVETSGAATVSLTFNEESFTPEISSGTFTQSLTFPGAGTYPVITTVTDETGGSSSVTRNIIYALDLPLWNATYPQLGTSTATTVAIIANADRDGQAYLICLPVGSVPPTGQQVRDGLAADGTPQPANRIATLPLVADTSATLACTDLTPFSSYDLYLVAADNAGSLQPLPVKVSLARSATGATLVSSLISPQEAGASVIFTGNAVGGDAGPYEYRFWWRSALLGSKWAVGQDYSPAASWEWNCRGLNLVAGSYFIQVDTRHPLNPARFEASKSLTYKLLPVFIPATGVTLSPDLASPRGAGSVVTFTAAAQNGSAGAYEYRFWWRSAASGAKWAVGQDYSPNPVWTWNTASLGLAAGNYYLLVDTRHVGSLLRSEVAKDLKYELK